MRIITLYKSEEPNCMTLYTTAHHAMRGNGIQRPLTSGTILNITVLQVTDLELLGATITDSKNVERKFNNRIDLTDCYIKDGEEIWQAGNIESIRATVIHHDIASAEVMIMPYSYRDCKDEIESLINFDGNIENYYFSLPGSTISFNHKDKVMMIQ